MKIEKGLLCVSGSFKTLSSSKYEKGPNNIYFDLFSSSNNEIDHGPNKNIDAFTNSNIFKDKIQPNRVSNFHLFQ